MTKPHFSSCEYIFIHRIQLSLRLDYILSMFLECMVWYDQLNIPTSSITSTLTIINYNHHQLQVYVWMGNVHQYPPSPFTCTVKPVFRGHRESVHTWQVSLYHRFTGEEIIASSVLLLFWDHRVSPNRRVPQRRGLDHRVSSHWNIPWRQVYCVYITKTLHTATHQLDWLVTQK